MMTGRRPVMAMAVAALRISGGDAFVEVGSSCVDVPTVRTYDAEAEASGSASAEGAVGVDGPAAVVEYPTCAETAVAVENSGESARASLDLSGRQIQTVESVPNVAILDLSNNSISTLKGFDAPAGLRVLNLRENAFKSLQNASIPATVQVLNLSANSFTSLADLDFPNALTELTVADGSLTVLENLTFPSTITSLNLSTNPITRVAGVVFPESLQHLTLLSVESSSSDASVLQEVEVRETDATLFTTLQTWDVSSTTVFTCSDTQAKLRYVQNTLLCVLDDAVFAAKYLSASSSASGSNNRNSTATIRQKVKETMQQPRTWFLIVGGVLLCGITVLMLAMGITSKRNHRRQQAELVEWRKQAEELSYKQLLQDAETSRHDPTPRGVPEFV